MNKYPRYLTSLLKVIVRQAGTVVQWESGTGRSRFAGVPAVALAIELGKRKEAYPHDT